MVQAWVHAPRASRTDTQDGAVLTATRELLSIETAADARTAALRLVDELGGIVVEPDTAGADALPIDLSFGVGDPVVPSAPADSVARLVPSRHLPGFVRDAHRAVELAARTERLTRDADIDVLTGPANRRVMGRAPGPAPDRRHRHHARPRPLQTALRDQIDRTVDELSHRNVRQRSMTWAR